MRLLADQTRSPALASSGPHSDSPVAWKPHEGTASPSLLASLPASVPAGVPASLLASLPASVCAPEVPSPQNDDAVNTTRNLILGPKSYPVRQGQSRPELPLSVPMAGGSIVSSDTKNGERERDGTQLLNRVGQSGFVLPGWTGRRVEATLDGDGAGPSCTGDLLNLNCTPKEEPWEAAGALLMDAGEMHRGREAGKELMLLAEQQARREAAENQLREPTMVNPTTSDSGGGSSSQSARKRKRQSGKAEKEGRAGLPGGGGVGSSEDSGAKEGMEGHASKSRMSDRGRSVRASQSARERRVTMGHDVVDCENRLNNERGARGAGEWSAGPGGRSSGEEDGSRGDRQEGELSNKDERVTEEGGGGCGSGVSGAESDIGDQQKERKKPGPSRKRGPVSKGCIDSRVSKHRHMFQGSVHSVHCKITCA